MTRKVYLKQFTDIVGAMKDFGEAWGYTKDRFITTCGVLQDPMLECDAERLRQRGEDLVSDVENLLARLKHIIRKDNLDDDAQ